MATSHDLQVMSPTQGVVENFEQNFEDQNFTSLTNGWGDAPSPPKDMINAEERLSWCLEYKRKQEQLIAAASSAQSSFLSFTSSNGLHDLPSPQVLDFVPPPQYDSSQYHSPFSSIYKPLTADPSRSSMDEWQADRNRIDGSLFQNQNSETFARGLNLGADAPANSQVRGDSEARHV